MAHFVIIEDAIGDAVDVNIYCSDTCAWDDEFYAGWNGANDVDYDTVCSGCGNEILAFRWSVKP